MIRASSSDVLQVDTGSLYPALHRLEKKHWIEVDWDLSENKQRVRVYRLTTTGRKQAHVRMATRVWHEVNRATQRTSKVPPAVAVLMVMRAIRRR
ncbi:MAG: helix-turn-helix transcriptional regulator [Gemmatimonadaceae bacterium]